MNVELWLYDLSGGLARQLSQQLTGTFIEYVPHTSIVLDHKIEIFFGHGIHRKIPGTSYGSPIEVLQMGSTELPMEVILEYIDSLESVYTPESYDLFFKNCNNFTQDLSVFLVGKEIPANIRDIPQKFLSTPMGQLMRGAVDDSLRSMTHAPDAPSSVSPGHSGNVVADQSTSRQHPHRRMELPGLQSKITSPVTYRKVPSLEKLMAKLKSVEEEETIVNLLKFVKESNSKAMPAFEMFNESIRRMMKTIPMGDRFALIDLIRVAALDLRFCGWILSDERRLESVFPCETDWSKEPLNLQITTLQLACNLFASPIFKDQLQTEGNLRLVMSNLISSCLLVSHSTVKSLAAALLYNLASFDHNERVSQRSDQVHVSEMSGVEEALLQAIIDENDHMELFHSLLLGLGLLMYCAPDNASVWDLCDAMELKTCLELKIRGTRFAREPMLQDILTMLSAR